MLEKKWMVKKKKEKKKKTIPASHQTAEGYNLRQWMGLLSGGDLKLYKKSTYI